MRRAFVAILLMAAAGPVAEASAGTRVTAQVPAVVTTSSNVTVRGTVSRRARVALQRRTAAGWRAVVRRKVAARQFTLRWRAPARGGVVELRVAAVGGGASAPARLAVAPVDVVRPAAVLAAPAGDGGALRVAGHLSVRRGDFIAVGAGRATPYGLLVRAAGSRRSGGQTVIDAEPASLLDAVPEGHVQIGRAQLARTAASAPRSFATPLSCGPGKSASVTGSLDAALDPDFELAWTPAGVTSATAVATVHGEADLGVSLGAGATCTLFQTAVATWDAPPLRAFVGPVPIVIVPRVRLYVSADARANTAISTRIKGWLSATAGLRYDGAAHAVGSFSQRLGYDAPAVRTDASLGARLTPSVEFLLYGQGGPRFDLSTGLDFSAMRDGNPWWTLSVPVTLSAGLHLPGLDLAQRTVFSRTYPLAQAPGGSGASPVPPPPSPSAPPPPPASRERARITWDTGADVDLHVWDSSGRHTWYGQSGIPGAVLSKDDTNGFGPETLEEDAPAGRTFTYGLCYFDSRGAAPTQVSVRLTDPDGRVRESAATLRVAGDSALIGSSPAGSGFSPPSGWCQPH
jgi:hypothetical protein